MIENEMDLHGTKFLKILIFIAALPGGAEKRLTIKSK